MGWGYAIGAGIQATAQGIQAIIDHNQNAKNRALQERINRQNYEAQKEFYKNSIQWRKQDALKAGINPIYALGGTSANFTPSFAASQETAPQVAGIGTNLGNAFIAYQQYKQQQQLQDKQLESMDASINKDNKQAEYYSALAEKTRGTSTETPIITATNATTGKTIATKETNQANEPYSKTTPTMNGQKFTGFKVDNMTTDGNIKMLQFTDPQIQQAWGDTKAEKGEINAFIEFLKSKTGLHIIKNKIYLEDGIYTPKWTKSAGLPILFIEKIDKTIDYDNPTEEQIRRKEFHEFTRNNPEIAKKYRLGTRYLGGEFEGWMKTGKGKKPY